jgi:hypothetical protein
MFKKICNYKMILIWNQSVKLEFYGVWHKVSFKYLGLLKPGITLLELTTFPVSKNENILG